MAFTYRDGVAVLELLIYIPCIFLALYICFRHGIGRTSGWIYLVLLCVARIVGASCQLDTITNHSRGIATATFICASIGLSTLIFACVGLLSRANACSTRPLHNMIFRLIQLISLAGIILAIIGGINSSTAAVPGTVDRKTKIGVILFLVAWLGLCALLAGIAMRIASVEQGEKRLLLAVAVSAPFVFVRLLYSLLGAFTKNKQFSSISGSVTINLCMAVLEEAVVVVVLLGIGLSLRVLPRPSIGAPVQKSPGYGYDNLGVEGNGSAPLGVIQQNGRADHGFPEQLPRREARRGGRRGGPIKQLIGLARDHYQQR